MRIVVTGGNGELDRSMIPHLLQGHTVVSIDRTLPSTVDPARRNVAQKHFYVQAAT